jgi:predicted ABC-type ATPase
MAKKPTVYVIAGPNGAGKTTFARFFLPVVKNCYQFANADTIAYGLSPFLPDAARIEAGKILLQRIWSLRDSGQTFGFEATLAGVTFVKFLKECRRRDFNIQIYFLWIRTLDLAMKRVADRVRRGGHNVPAADVRRRYYLGLSNFFHLYRPLADFFAILDNSTANPELVAVGDPEMILPRNKKTLEHIQKMAKFISK